MKALLVSLFLFSFISSAQAFTGATRNLAVIFNGPTICGGCETALGKLMRNRGLDVKYVHPGESTPALLSHAAIYMVPGGEDVDNLDQGWTRDDRQAVRDYVKNGGLYYGVCLGGYWAGDWPGTQPGFESLGIIPAHVIAYSKTTEARVEKINWNGQTRYAYFQDGPAFIFSDPSAARIFATYEDGSVATFISKFGNGRVAISGVHFEAPKDWYDSDHLKDPDPLHAELGEELFDALFFDVPGT